MDKFTESLTKGKFNESVGVVVIPSEDASQVAESAKKSGKELPDSIEVTVEAIHAGMTKNRTFYSAQSLEASTPSWTTPYNKPVIKNHDTWEEPTGRVIAAEFKQSMIKPDTHTIQLKLQITDPDAIQKVMDGRYLTLSIGGSTNSATCSICGKNIVEEGWCGHSRGKKYEGKEAYWIIGNMEFDEISWVNVPADANAQVVHIKQSVEDSSPERRGESVSKNIFDDIDNVLQENEQPDAQDNQDEKDGGAQQEGTEPQGEPETPGEPEGTEADKQTEGAEQTPEERIAELEEQVRTLTEERDNAISERDTVISEKDALTQTVTERDASITDLNAELTQVKEERDNFRNMNITLAKAAQRIMAERAVDLRVLLGEATKEERESLLTEYAKTPTKILEATIKDMLEKPIPSRGVRESAQVQNPGVVIPNSKHSIDENGDVTEGAGAEDNKKEFTLEDLGNKMVEFIANRARMS